jgi:CheY-like chemotaxis protein
MSDQFRNVTILIADDDEDDRMLTRHALKANHVTNEIREVTDGEELMQYLRRQGAYADPASSPRPGIIFLDLNMPRKDGREALQEIKADPELRRIPVVILTTSREDEDVIRSYDLGVNSFIVKPVTLQGFIDAMKAFEQFWLALVEIPGTHETA